MASTPMLARSGGIGCGRADLTVTTTPAPMQNAKGVEKHLNLAQRASSHADVAVIGDSIAEQWPASLLETAFPGKTILNFGIGGDRVQSLLWRIKSGAYDHVNPATVVIVIGTNNMPYDAPCAIVAGVEAVLSEVKARWPGARIDLFEVTPRGKPPQMLLQKEAERNEINAGFAALAQRFKAVSIVPVDGVLQCPEVTECPDLLPDLLHLTESGYQHLTERLRSVLGQRP